jgi:hypothetical protein
MRKAYYYSLIFVLAFIILVSISNWFYFTIPTADLCTIIFPLLVQPALALCMILFESYNSRKPIKKINLILIPVFLIGFTIDLMDYPFGTCIFLAAALAVIVFLFIEAFGRREGRLIMLLQAIFILTEYLKILYRVFDMPGAALLALLNSLIIPVLFAFILIQFFKRKKIA